MVSPKVVAPPVVYLASGQTSGRWHILALIALQRPKPLEVVLLVEEG